MERRRQQLETDRNAGSADDQVQAPAKEVLPLGGTAPEERRRVRPTQLLAARSTGQCADRHGHTIDNVRLTVPEEVPDQLREELQPTRQGVQAAVEARGAERVSQPAR